MQYNKSDAQKIGIGESEYEESSDSVEKEMNQNAESMGITRDDPTVVVKHLLLQGSDLYLIESSNFNQKVDGVFDKFKIPKKRE